LEDSAFHHSKTGRQILERPVLTVDLEGLPHRKEIVDARGVVDLCLSVWEKRPDLEEKEMCSESHEVPHSLKLACVLLDPLQILAEHRSERNVENIDLVALYLGVEDVDRPFVYIEGYPIVS
jgi:hypothetical protein